MGVIGYEFLTETTPFHDDNVHETYSNILGHCDDKLPTHPLTYPDGLDVSTHFRSLIDGLVTNKSRRLSYHQIVKHPFFDGIEWDQLRHQVPPIIPSLSSDDDTSNFEDVDHKGRRSTYSVNKCTGFAKGNNFSGQNLPFIGYSYVHEAAASGNATAAVDTVAAATTIEKHHRTKSSDKLMAAKTRELQATIDEHMADIRKLQQQLLNAQRKCAQTEMLERILREAKDELTNMKDILKEKTVELAACKTDNKALKSSLQIQEEQRLKSDANISEVLNSTYQKWEKAKKLAEQNYEKQVTEKKTEIICLTQTLQARESELATKVDECKHLLERMHGYKDMLKASKEQNAADKDDYDKNKRQLTESYETKMQELKQRVQQEKQMRLKAADELKALRRDLNESVCSTKSIAQSKEATEISMNELRQRVTQQIEENNQIRQQKADADRAVADIQKKCDELTNELDRNQQQIQQLQFDVIAAEAMINDDNQQRRSTTSDIFRSAQGSLESIVSASVVEEQLRTDLQMAKESEHLQRTRADRLEEAVNRLEGMVNRLHEPTKTTQPAKSSDETLLERQNEKLEDQLAAVREQAIVERQASRTAHLSLYKLEKQVDDLNMDRKLSVRRIELAEEKLQKQRTEKEEIERTLRDTQSTLRAKEERIRELQAEIVDLKKDVKKEHSMWSTSEQERMREKSEIIEQISRAHTLEENVTDLRRKLHLAEKRTDALTLETQQLTKERTMQSEQLLRAEDTIADLEQQLTAAQRNYAMLKEACAIMETQLNELEAMHESETRQNRIACQKNDELWVQVRARDTDIATLRHRLTVQDGARETAEARVAQLAGDLQRSELALAEHAAKCEQYVNELERKTGDLFELQENIEVLAADLSNLHRINETYSRELHILKEENTKVLTELFLAKEESNKLAMERKELCQQLSDVRREVEQMNGTLSEQKNYYLHRDIKAEATVAQYKKLSAYLQQRVDELSQKKKKSLADVLFGSSNASSKKENFPPPPPPTMSVEQRTVYKQLKEKLNKEQLRNVQLKEQLLQAKMNIQSQQVIYKYLYIN